MPGAEMSAVSESHLTMLSGKEEQIAALLKSRPREVFHPGNDIDLAALKSVCLVALHMHQPLILAGGGDLKDAPLISNLAAMQQSDSSEGRYNAEIFRECYRRMGRIIPELLMEHAEPRIMLEYSGTLLYGLQVMGAEDVLGALSLLACDRDCRRRVEWLGCTWGHAVAPSTPVADYRLQVRTWQHHFASLFGGEALQRVRGFSPAEMALPNHPDVAFEFVRTLRECGYEWVLVQEHTVEEPGSGAAPRRKYLPHRLVCRNAEGQEASIIALIKTQGSDTKLIGQMQPYYEAKGLDRMELGGRSVPQAVTQIADGENGGVMMNEFPAKYKEAVRESSGSATALMNGTEYLEHLFALGVREEDLPLLQPLHQRELWRRYQPGDGTARLAQVIGDLAREVRGFHMEGGSWTNNISWVRGYENILQPMQQASVRFHEAARRLEPAAGDPRYQQALLYLLCSQTSCFRYWGQGVWTEYGIEICRRAEAAMQRAGRHQE